MGGQSAWVSKPLQKRRLCWHAWWKQGPDEPRQPRWQAPVQPGSAAAAWPGQHRRAWGETRVCLPAAIPARLMRVPFFDGNELAAGDLRVERGAGRRDEEGHAVVRRSHRQAVRPDLVGSVAIGSDAVRAHHHCAAKGAGVQGQAARARESARRHMVAGAAQRSIAQRRRSTSQVVRRAHRRRPCRRP